MVEPRTKDLENESRSTDPAVDLAVWVELRGFEPLDLNP
jgi:hypothetical protein